MARHLKPKGPTMTTATTTPRQTDLLAEAAVAAVRLREAGARFAAAAEELTLLAEELAEADTAARLTADAAGIRAPQPPARELAAEVVHAALAPLRPYVPFVTAAAGRRAAEALGRFRAPDDDRTREGDPNDD